MTSPAGAAAPGAAAAPAASPAQGPGPASGSGPEAGARPAAAAADGAGAEDAAGQQADSSAEDERTDAGAATGKPGQGSRRYGFLRDADRIGIGTVEGDAVGVQNVFLGGRRRRMRPVPLPHELADPVLRSFVSPPGWDDIRAEAARRTVVILRGQAGWGRQAAAIRLLQGPPRQVFLLPTAADPADLPEILAEDGGPVPGAGYLADQPAGFSRLRAAMLMELQQTLDACGACLVLTVSSEMTLPDHGLHGYTVDMQERPARPDITASRLAYLLGEERAALVLDRADVKDLITHTLAGGGSCESAAYLAAAIADEDGASRDGAGDFSVPRIRTRMSQRDHDEFSTWFGGLPDTRSRCFAVALAVLDGLPYETVAAAARMLYQKFEADDVLVLNSSEERAPEPQRPFRVSRRTRLQALGARTLTVTIPGDYGPVESVVVAYDHPRSAAGVLAHAWAEYEVHDTLLDWLRNLADDDSEPVRIQAGLALGQLTASSFQYLVSEVLDPWASSGLRSRRETVAYALRRAVASEAGLHDSTRLMIEAWYSDPEDPAGQATAARAYGLVGGLVSPQEATAALCRLLVSTEFEVKVAVANALADLLAPEVNSEDGPPPSSSASLVSIVLSGLADAMADRQRTGGAQLAFLILALSLEAWAPGGDGEACWPALLLLVTRLPGARQLVTDLWQRTLESGREQDNAERVLTFWALSAEKDPRVREALLRLARAIARDRPRCRATLRRYAEQWARDDSLTPLSITSTELKAVLATESEVP